MKTCNSAYLASTFAMVQSCYLMDPLDAQLEFDPELVEMRRVFEMSPREAAANAVECNAVLDEIDADVLAVIEELEAEHSRPTVVIAKPLRQLQQSDLANLYRRPQLVVDNVDFEKMHPGGLPPIVHRPLDLVSDQSVRSPAPAFDVAGLPELLEMNPANLVKYAASFQATRVKNNMEYKVRTSPPGQDRSKYMQIAEEAMAEVDGVWEPKKAMVDAPVYRETPVEFLDEPNQAKVVEETDMPRRPKTVPHNLLVWVAMVDGLNNEQAAEESCSIAGLRLLREIKGHLFDKDHMSLNRQCADELEALGYRVSYSRRNGVVLMELKSGTFRWTV